MDCTHELSGSGQGWHLVLDTVQIIGGDISKKVCYFCRDTRYEWVQAPLITCQSSLNSCCWAISVQIFVIARNWQTGDFSEAACVIFATFCHYFGFFEPGEIVTSNIKKTRASPKPLTNTDLMKTTCYGEIYFRFTILFIPHLKYFKNRIQVGL